MISVSAGYGTDGSRTPTIVADRSPSPHRPADHRSIAPEGRRPETVRQHRGARRLRSVVGRIEQAAEDRSKSHDLEVRPADDPGANHAGLAEANHGESDLRKVAERAERMHAFAHVTDFGNGEIRVLGAHAARGLPYINEAIFVAVRQWPQQHAPDRAENRCIGADPEGQREHDGGGQSLDSGQRTKGEAQIGHDRLSFLIPCRMRTP